MKKRVFVLGTRGFPGIQGGVERHCRELYPRIVLFSYQVTVVARAPYFRRGKRIPRWEGVDFLYLWSPGIDGLEAFFHTFWGVVAAYLKKAEILHFHAVGPSLFIPLAKCLGMKVVMTHHGPDYERKKWSFWGKTILRLGEWLGVKWADEVIAVGDYVKRRIEEKFSRKVNVIFQGVTASPPVFPGREMKRFSLEPKKYILAVGRLVPEKGLRDLVEAFANFPSNGYKLVVCGGNTVSFFPRKSRGNLPDDSRIVFTGEAGDETLGELYSQAALFVSASYYEGMPLAFLEALSYGAKVLVSDIPPHREIPLREEQYFKPGDTAALTEKIAFLLGEKEDEEQKGRIRRLLEEKFSWEKNSKKTVALYDKITERRFLKKGSFPKENNRR